MKLTAQQVKAAADSGKPQKLGDGGGLYLVVRAGGRCSWFLRYQHLGRRRDFGLGPYPEVSLSKARQQRDMAQAQLRAGTDPKDARDAAAAQEAARRAAELGAQAATVHTFRSVSETFIEGQEQGWRNPKHRQQWRNTLRDYAHPVIGDKPISEITTSDVVSILQPVWLEKNETAKRVQGRIERVLDYAKTVELRQGDNPARWRGHLDNILPKPGKVQRVRHQRALHWREAPGLVTQLHKSDAPAARALLLTLLCATRTTETLQAQWSEFDLEAGLWTIPGERMKASKPHRIPLPAAAMDVLRQQEVLSRNDWVFPSQHLRSSKPLSGMAMTKVLARNGWLAHTTVHGLRSTFRDWVSERTNYPDRLAEVALAHQLSDRVQAAYNRTDQLEKRREMMEAWAQYLEAKPGNVVQLPAGKKA